MKKLFSLRSFAMLTALGTYVMLLMGAIVTKTGSGKGCGQSWPFCHGQLIPESLPISTVIEYSHRVVSGGVGLLILVLVIWSWRKYAQDQRIKLLGGLSLFFVLLQGALGALTVVFEQVFAKKAALALHFGFSLISFASVVLLVILLFHSENKTKIQSRPLTKSFCFFVWGLTGYAYLVIYTGAFVRHMQATMGCGASFPLCGATYFPGLSSLAEIHMLHRCAAILLWCLVLGFWLHVVRGSQKDDRLVRTSGFLFMLITLQVISGVVTIISGGQLISALLHTTIACLFFTCLTYLCLLTTYSKPSDVLDNSV